MLARLIAAGVLAWLNLSLCLPAFADVGRGGAGLLRIYYWQAPSTLNPYMASGIKDIEAASLVLEPLARLDPQGEMVPWLARELPTYENGGVAADMLSITWNLQPGLTWSDGSPVTSDDIKFTVEYCLASGSGCAQRDKFRDVSAVETPDALTAVLHFAVPTAYPYGPFVGPQAPVIQAAQFAKCLGAPAGSCTGANFAPIGTGPFRVVAFLPGDAARFDVNPSYRVAQAPGFDAVLLKGGGDAVTAARAVLVTGEFDYAWNLQMSPDVLAAMEAKGNGRIVTGFSTLVERLVLNLRDSENPVSVTEASTRLAALPMADIAVRRALSMALDRALMVRIGYGAAGRVACNIVPAPAAYASQANDSCAVQDIQGAQDVLSNAGWVDDDGDGIRTRDGRELRFTFQTSANGVRQDFQMLAKEWWRQIGIRTDLRVIDGSVYFSANPDNPDSLEKFGADIQMYASASDGTDPEAYLSGWTCENVPNSRNGWQGRNVGGWCDPAYDALLQELSMTTVPEDRAALARRLNDMLVQNYVVVPLVDRGRVSAHSNTLAGVRMNAWDSELWNIADWRRITP